MQSAFKHRKHRQLAGLPSPSDKEVSRGYSRLGTLLSAPPPVLLLLPVLGCKRVASASTPLAPLSQHARCRAVGKEVLLPVIAIFELCVGLHTDIVA